MDETFGVKFASKEGNSLESGKKAPGRLLSGLFWGVVKLDGSYQIFVGNLFLISKRRRKFHVRAV